MTIDLKSLSPKQLQQLISEANRERKRKQKRSPIAQVRAKLTRLASAEGYSLLELFGVKDGARPRGDTRDTGIKPDGPRSSTKGTKVAPKYRMVSSRKNSARSRSSPSLRSRARARSRRPS